MMRTSKNILENKLNNIPFLIGKKDNIILSNLRFKDLYNIFFKHIRFINFVFFKELIDRQFSYRELNEILSKDFSLLDDYNNLKIHEFMLQCFPSSIFSKLEDRKQYYSHFIKVKTYAKPVFLSMSNRHLNVITDDFLNVFKQYLSFVYESLKIKLFYYEKDKKLWESFLPLISKENPQLYSSPTGVFIDLFPFLIYKKGKFYFWKGSESIFSYFDENENKIEIKNEKIRNKILKYFEHFNITGKSNLVLKDKDSIEVKQSFKYLENVKNNLKTKNYESLIRSISDYKFNRKDYENINYYLEYLLGLSYYKLGNTSQAVIIFNKVIENSPELYYPYLQLLYIYGEENNRKKVRALSEKLKRIVFSPEILRTSSRLKKSLLSEKKKDQIRIKKEIINLKQKVEQISPVVIGREKETDEIIKVLSCKSKNNVIILGEPGVGKTYVIYNLVNKAIKQDLPDSIKNSPLYELNIGATFSGTKYRGQLEEKLESILSKVAEDKGILFIDDLNFLISSDISKNSSVDFASFVKPYIEKQQIRIIATLNFEDYVKNISNIPVFTRLFQKIDLKELSNEDVSAILKIKADELSRYHNVEIDIDSIVKHIETVKQFFRERMLPDKAIEILDRTCAKVNHEKNKGKRKDNLVKDIDFLKTVAQARGVEISTISETLRDRLTKLDNKLKKRVIGQENVINSLVKKIIPSKMGFKLNPDRPDGVFLFIGPTGVGKTELARALARELYGDARKLLKFDMSEYMEEFTFSRLIGAAPGYVGYYDQNQLTDEMKKDPYRVILLDEIEKAHPQLINLFLQVFDTGVLTDAKGNKAYFDKSVIIMTSNVGTSLFSKKYLGFSKVSSKITISDLKGEMKKFFKPEFLNRIDEIMFFESLDVESMKDIVLLKINEFNKLKQSEDLYIQIDEESVEYLANKGYSREYGARHLIRILNDELFLKLAEYKLNSKKEINHIQVIYDDKNDCLTFKPVEKYIANKLAIDSLEKDSFKKSSN